MRNKPHKSRGCVNQPPRPGQIFVSAAEVKQRLVIFARPGTVGLTWAVWDNGRVIRCVALTLESCRRPAGQSPLSRRHNHPLQPARIHLPSPLLYDTVKLKNHPSGRNVLASEMGLVITDMQEAKANYALTTAVNGLGQPRALLLSPSLNT